MTLDVVLSTHFCKFQMLRKHEVFYIHCYYMLPLNLVTLATFYCSFFLNCFNSSYSSFSLFLYLVHSFCVMDPYFMFLDSRVLCYVIHDCKLRLCEAIALYVCSSLILPTFSYSNSHSNASTTDWDDDYLLIKFWTKLYQTGRGHKLFINTHIVCCRFWHTRALWTWWCG